MFLFWLACGSILTVILAAHMYTKYSCRKELKKQMPNNPITIEWDYYYMNGNVYNSRTHEIVIMEDM